MVVFADTFRLVRRDGFGVIRLDITSFERLERSVRMSSDLSRHTLSGTRSRHARLDQVDGLRAIACISVFILHAYVYVGQPRLDVRVGKVGLNVFRFLQYGSTGVHLFLILSGFCLFAVFAGADGARRFSLQKFWVKRARRILPAYYATIVLCVLFALAIPMLNRSLAIAIESPPLPSFYSMAAHLFLVHSLDPGINFNINGPFWSLGLEWQYYIVFPLMVWSFHRLGAWRSVAIAIGATVVYRITTYYLTRGMAVQVVWTATSSNIPGRLGEFALGMLAAWQWERTSGMRSSTAFMANVSCTLILFGVGTKLAPFTPFHDLVWGGGYFFLLKAALIPNGILSRLLSWKPLVWIGTISYSVYLIHLPVLDLLKPVLVSSRHPYQSLIWLFTIGGLTTLAASVVMFVLFERPFMGAVKRRAVDEAQGSAPLTELAHENPAPEMMPASSPT